MRRTAAVPFLWCLVLLSILVGCGEAGLSADKRVQDARQSVPFTMLLPRHVPEGFTLQSVSVDSAAPSSDRVVFHMGFSAKDGRNFSIDQSNYLDTTGGQPIKVGGLDGKYVEIARGDSTTRAIGFTSPSKTSVTVVSPSLSKEDLLGIATSMLE